VTPVGRTATGLTVQPVPEPRLLYVEDDPDIRDALSCVLAREGYQVTSVGNAEDGLDELTRTQYDIVLTDYQLPGNDGGWLLRSASAAGYLARTTAIVLTGHDHLVGLDGYVVLTKPIDLDVLLATLARAIDTRPASQRPPAPSPSPAPSVLFTLYITGQAPSSVRALRHVRAAIAQFGQGQVQLTVHDVADAARETAIAEALESDRVVVTPTLVRTGPAPQVWVVGDLARSDVVARLIRDALPHERPRSVASRLEETECHGQNRAEP
jgi:DNA-binding response OmpR family regulator